MFGHEMINGNMAPEVGQKLQHHCMEGRQPGGQHSNSGRQLNEYKNLAHQTLLKFGSAEANTAKHLDRESATGKLY